MASSTDAGSLRTELVVTNVAASPLLAGYSVRVAADVLGSALATSLDELRVYDVDIELDRVIDVAPPGEQPAMWFALSRPIAAGESDSYEVAVDASGAPQANAANVFLLHDEFDPGGLGSQWLTLGGPLTDGELQLAAGDVAVTTTSATDGVPAASLLEARVTVRSPNDPGGYFWWGYQHTGDFGTGDPFVNWVGDAGMQYPWFQTFQNQRGPMMALDDAPHWYRIARLPTKTQFFRDGALVWDLAVTDATDYSVQLRNQSPVAEVAVDWVRVRHVVDPEPDVAILPLP